MCVPPGVCWPSVLSAVSLQCLTFTMIYDSSLPKITPRKLFASLPVWPNSAVWDTWMSQRGAEDAAIQFIKLCSCCLWRHLGNRGNWWTYWVTLAEYETSVAEKVKDTNTSSALHLSSLSADQLVTSWVTTSCYELLRVPYMHVHVFFCMPRWKVRLCLLFYYLFICWASVALWALEHSLQWA